MAFPVVDAFLIEPKEGSMGKIAICTNTLAPSMVSNEIPLDLRSDITALGALVVNRDGAERMIINCLAHPSIEYVILFGQEALSFCPSTNLLLALMDGYRDDKPGNTINGGKGVSPQYPNVSADLLERFRQRVKVIPLFTHHSSEQVVERYLDWLAPRIPTEVFDLVVKTVTKKKIYYDSLVKMITLISSLPPQDVSAMELDPADFQHLQPPIIEIAGDNKPIAVPFEVFADGQELVVHLDCGDVRLLARCNDSFLLAYSLMVYLQEHQLKLDPLHQLWLGAELSRIEMQIKCSVQSQRQVVPRTEDGPRMEVPIAARTILKADKRYYYRISIKEGKMAIASMAHDTCDSVFELRGKRIGPLLEKLAQENRFQDYDQAFLHRVDVGIETGRAAIALDMGMSYFQDFRNLFALNTTTFPFLFAEGDSFLAVHQRIITQLYTQGITVTHPDAHKGTMRSASILAAYRRSGESLSHFPAIYGSGTLSPSVMRQEYKQQLLSIDNKGTYTYGNRTRAHFGKDQLSEAVTFLIAHPDQCYVISRFDPLTDMTLKETPITNESGEVIRTRLEATHDPCLTHDIYFLCDGRLHSFHIARAHNIVNAYPENIFGLHDAYDQTIADDLGVMLGDLFMFSSRGNMLLLTEEQKAKKLIAEPAKPIEELDNSMGPYDLRRSFPSKGIATFSVDLELRTDRPKHPCLEVLEHYEGVNLIEKATRYLRKRGSSHNNVLLSCHDPRSTHLITPQRRLIFYQCNERGGKLHATAVFVEGKNEYFPSDLDLCHYLGTQYHQALDIPLGTLTLIYVPMKP